RQLDVVAALREGEVAGQVYRTQVELHAPARHGKVRYQGRAVHRGCGQFRRRIVDVHRVGRRRGVERHSEVAGEAETEPIGVYRARRGAVGAGISDDKRPVDAAQTYNRTRSRQIEMHISKRQLGLSAVLGKGEVAAEIEVA